MRNRPVMMLGMTGLAENIVFFIIFSIAAGVAADFKRHGLMWAFGIAAAVMVLCATLRYLDGDRFIDVHRGG